MPKILIIEDESLPRETVVRLLNRKGYETLEAQDGQMGVNLAREHQPDLVLSDIHMPKLNGFQVLQHLRASPETSTIPVIFLSAMNDLKASRQGMAQGADDYLGKPYSADELLQIVSVQLQKKARIQEKQDTSLKVLRKNIIYALPHELRTPLSIILGYGQILEADAKKVQPDEILEFAQSIVASGQRLQRVIENYLVYAQIEVLNGDKNEIEKLRNHIIKDVAKVIEEAARKRAAQYHREDDLYLDVCHLALRISEANLSKIVDELLDNAFKFSRPGSKVVVKAVRDGDSFRLYIRDHGRGMTNEQLNSLGAYMQFDRELFEQQGLGLGFSIAQKLVDLHSGKLNIESRPNQGTMISVELSIY